jgi:murein DD-endopeptidase MepM/ murein hydrolase activator NlpD
VNLSKALRFWSAAITLLLAGLLVPPVTGLGAAAGAAGVATPAAVMLPVAGPTPAPPAASGVTSADQMAALWNGFRTAQLQATVLQGQIAAETRQRTALQGQIASYTAQIAQAQARQAADAAQIVMTDGQLTQIEANIVTTTAQATALQATVMARVVTIYKQGPASYVAMLVSATSFQDFISRLQYVDSVVGADRGKLTSLNQVNDQLAQEQAQANERRKELAAAEAAVAADGARLATLRTGETQASAALATELATQQTQLQQVDAEKATYTADMALLAGESSSITTFVRAHQGNEAYTWSGKKLLWPVHGPISSPFGPRTNPIFGTPEFHTGIDIAADSGLPIVAAAAGKVIYAGVMQGYGNVVIIDHGGALATLYAHMSVLGASVGEAVSQGQRIGAVGCTGLCTGPHLHFETRVGGTPVQPLDLLP